MNILSPHLLFICFYITCVLFVNLSLCRNTYNEFPCRGGTECNLAVSDVKAHFVEKYIDNKKGYLNLFRVRKKKKKKKKKIKEVSSSRTIIYPNGEMYKEDNYVNGKYLAHTDKEILWDNSKKRRTAQGAYNSIISKSIKHVNNMYNFNYNTIPHYTTYDSTTFYRSASCRDVSNYEKLKSVNNFYPFNEQRSRILVTDSSDFDMEKKTLSSGNDQLDMHGESEYFSTLQSRKNEKNILTESANTSSETDAIDGARVMEQIEEVNSVCGGNNLILISEIYEYEVRQYLKNIRMKSLSQRKHKNVVNKCEMYFSGCREKMVQTENDPIQHQELGIKLHYTEGENKNSLYQSKSVKRKKKKKEDGIIIDNYEYEVKEEDFEQCYNTTMKFIPRKENCIYCIKKKVENNVNYVSIIEKYVKYKVHYNSVKKRRKRNVSYYHSQKKNTESPNFLKNYIDKLIFKKKRTDEKKNSKNTTVVLKKKVLLIFDHIKKEMTYLTISYIAKDQMMMIYPVKTVEYEILLKGPYTPNFMQHRDTNQTYEFNDEKEYGKGYLPNLHNKKQNVCYYNYSYNLMDHFKNVFVKTCKVENEHIFKNNFLKNANHTEKDCYINKHLKKEKGKKKKKKKKKHKVLTESSKNYNIERKNVIISEKKKINQKKNSQVDNYSGKFAQNREVKTMWRSNIAKKYLFLTRIKGFKTFHSHMLRIFSVYKDMFLRKSLTFEDNDSGIVFIYERGNSEYGSSLEGDRNGQEVVISQVYSSDTQEQQCRKKNPNDIVKADDDGSNISDEKPHSKSIQMRNNGGGANNQSFHYYFIHYSDKNYIFELSTNTEINDDLLVNGEILYPIITESEKKLINNMKQYIKDGGNYSIYIDKITPDIYSINCKKFNTIKWVLILFLIPSWLIIILVYFMFVKNVWRQMLNPLIRLLLFTSPIRLSSYVMLLIFCIIHCYYGNNKCVEYTLLGYLSLNTMFITIFYGNLLLISKGYMITRRYFNKKECIYMTLIVSYIYISMSYNNLYIMHSLHVILSLHMSIPFILISNILCIIKFLKVKLALVRNFGMYTWEESILLKLSMYRYYLSLIIVFFSFEIFLDILKITFNFYYNNIAFIEDTIELFMWCGILYLFRYRGDILYFSVFPDSITLNIIPLYIVNSGEVVSAGEVVSTGEVVSNNDFMENDKEYAKYHVPIFILNPLEYREQNFLSRMSIGWPINKYQGKKNI
ncbi:conserved Plasmodium protein, unknown function [Plasmodium ovale]|uniref:Serpentine receptor n=1 Tax=Plasmodium ovale TaxID=36330 RepID=A0A1D3TLH8_PLAOA|nr:conserved Plasmodium protein, unknown function [Plasmodium ovale]